jgi:hypothetical protein
MFEHIRTKAVVVLPRVPYHRAVRARYAQHQSPAERVHADVLDGGRVPAVRAAFGNELEDRTLANLTLSPIPRWKIVVPKLLGVITIAAPFIASAGSMVSG